MRTQLKNNNYKEVLDTINIDYDDAVHEYLLLTLHGKIADLLSECELFEKKYKTTFLQFEKQIENLNSENFNQYNDFLAWKFTNEGLHFYQLQLDKII